MLLDSGDNHLLFVEMQFVKVVVRSGRLLPVESRIPPGSIPILLRHWRMSNGNDYRIFRSLNTCCIFLDARSGFGAVESKGNFFTEWNERWTTPASHEDEEKKRNRATLRTIDKEKELN